MAGIPNFLKPEYDPLALANLQDEATVNAINKNLPVANNYMTPAALGRGSRYQAMGFSPYADKQPSAKAEDVVPNVGSPDNLSLLFAKLAGGSRSQPSNIKLNYQKPEDYKSDRQDVALPEARKLDDTSYVLGGLAEGLQAATGQRPTAISNLKDVEKSNREDSLKMWLNSQEQENKRSDDKYKEWLAKNANINAQNQQVLDQAKLNAQMQSSKKSDELGILQMSEGDVRNSFNSFANNISPIIADLNNKYGFDSNKPIDFNEKELPAAKQTANTLLGSVDDVLPALSQLEPAYAAQVKKKLDGAKDNPRRAYQIAEDVTSKLKKYIGKK